MYSAFPPMLEYKVVTYLIQMRKRIWTKWFLFLCINLNCWRVTFLAKAQTCLVCSNQPRMLKVARSTPGTCCTDLYCWRWSQGLLLMRVGINGHSIRSTISDAIVRSWLWSTATRSCPLCYFSSITATSWYLTRLTCSGSRFSSEGLLAKWDLTTMTTQHK